MRQIKKGDIVGRKSYNKDVIFVVKNIISTRNGKIAILRGLIERVEADCHIEDLELIDKKTIKNNLKLQEIKAEKRINSSKNNEKDTQYRIGILNLDKRNKERIITGKILHLDGDNIFIYTLKNELNIGHRKIKSKEEKMPIIH